jgi:hypothetical protein
VEIDTMSGCTAPASVTSVSSKLVVVRPPWASHSPTRGRNPLIARPATSARSRPTSAEAAGLTSSTTPRRSVLQIASIAVSMMARACASLRRSCSAMSASLIRRADDSRTTTNASEM